MVCIFNMLDLFIIINYPVCISSISHLSSEVIVVLRGEAEEDNNNEEDKCEYATNTKRDKWFIPLLYTHFPLFAEDNKSFILRRRITSDILLLEQ